MKHYELTIPEEYKVDKVIDAKNPKTGVIMNLVALIIMAIICAIGIIIYIQVNDGFKFEVDENNFIALILYFIGMFAVIIIHELIHGLFYKIFTKQKLTFGFTWSAAYCGVPHIYVRKTAMIITCIAPCVIISSTLLIPLILINNTIYFLFILLLFALHFGGCCGDLYCILLFVFKYRKKDILVNDTGAKQTIYIKK